ncbi:MAG: hypothetical protein IPP23_10070 [Sphingomonadales bacterium]|nr:hypothetical protein [Sphingomonadales bacterium]
MTKRLLSLGKVEIVLAGVSTPCPTAWPSSPPIHDGLVIYGKYPAEPEKTSLAFFDAIAPIVYRRQHRYGFSVVCVALGQRGDGRDYIGARWTRSNIWPSTKACSTPKADFREWEKDALFRRLLCRSK